MQKKFPGSQDYRVKSTFVNNSFSKFLQAFLEKIK
jgi:hypothetical protein